MQVINQTKRLSSEALDDFISTQIKKTFPEIKNNNKGIMTESYDSSLEPKITPALHLKGLETAKKLALTHFKEPLTYKSKLTADDIFSLCVEMRNKATMDGYAELTGSTKSKDPVSFRPKDKVDLDFFHISEGNASQLAKSLSCISYAFLIVNETRAKNSVFSGGYKPNDLIHLLLSWNYSSHALEDAKDGDLVVYLRDNGEVTHLGVWQESGQVHSKLGNGTSHAYTHNVFDVPCAYGRNVILFRKNGDYTIHHK